MQIVRFRTLDAMLDIEILIKFAPASVATAFASIVFPVPGGPNKSIPLHGCHKKADWKSAPTIPKHLIPMFPLTMIFPFLHESWQEYFSNNNMILHVRQWWIKFCWDFRYWHIVPYMPTSSPSWLSMSLFQSMSSGTDLHCTAKTVRKWKDNHRITSLSAADVWMKYWVISDSFLMWMVHISRIKWYFSDLFKLENFKTRANLMKESFIFLILNILIEWNGLAVSR